MQSPWFRKINFETASLIIFETFNKSAYNVAEIMARDGHFQKDLGSNVPFTLQVFFIPKNK